MGTENELSYLFDVMFVCPLCKNGRREWKKLLTKSVPSSSTTSSTSCASSLSFSISTLFVTLSHLSFSTCASPFTLSHISVFIFLVFPPFFSPLERTSYRLLHLLPFGMLMWSADAWHSDQSEDSLKGGENWGVVGREMRKPEWKRESIGPPGFQGREGKVNNRAVEGRDGGMWRERAGVWKLIIAGRAALDDFTLPHPLSLSLSHHPTSPVMLLWPDSASEKNKH